MVRKKKTLKSVKTPQQAPTTLSVGEVLEIEGLNHELALLKQRTKELKLVIDKVSLKKKLYEQEVIIQAQNLSDAERELREHGERVMKREETLVKFRDRLCERYNVSTISYNPDTLELIKEH